MAELLLRRCIRSFPYAKRSTAYRYALKFQRVKREAVQFGIYLYLLGERIAGPSGVGGRVTTADEGRIIERIHTDTTTRAASMIDAARAIFFEAIMGKVYNKAFAHCGQ